MYRPLALISRLPLADGETVLAAADAAGLDGEKAWGLWSAACMTSAMVPNLFLFLFLLLFSFGGGGEPGGLFPLLLLVEVDDDGRGGRFDDDDVDDRSWP